MLEKIGKYKFPLLLAVLGLVPVFWFKHDYINGGDFTFPMASMKDAWTGYAHIWTDKWGLGLVNSRAIPQLLFMVLFTVADNIGISTAISERILFYSLFAMSGLSVYYLVKLMPFKENKDLTAVVAGLFYMFNPFNIVFYWHILDGMVFVYAFLPALLVLYLKWMKSGRLIYPFLFFILPWFGGYTFSNPLVLPILWTLLLVFTLILKGDRTALACSGFYIKALAGWMLFNGWWLVPLFGSIRDEYSGLSATIGSTWDTLNAFSSHTSFLNLFRNTDLYWAFKSRFMGDLYYTYSESYSTFFFILISFVLPVMMFFPLYLRVKTGRRLPKFIILLYGLTLVYIFFAKGTHSPYGNELYNLLFKLPLLPAFRAPVHKIGTLLSINYAILFGYGLVCFYEFIKQRSRNLSFAATGMLGAMAIMIYPYPLWTGEVIHNGGKNYPSFQVSVPDYYYEAAEWMNNEKEYFRYYTLPQSPTFNVAYDWENGYIGSDPKVFIFSKPGVFSAVDERAQLPYTLLSDTDEKDISKILALQNVKYLILHNDISEKLWDIFTGRKISSGALKAKLAEQNNIEYVKTVGKLDFYKVSDESFLPHVYPAKHKAVLADSELRAMPALAGAGYLNGNTAIVLLNQQNGNKMLALAEKNSLTDKLLVVNRSFNDVVLDTASIFSRDAQISGKKPFWTLVDKKGSFEFNSEKPETKEIWLKAEGEFLEAIESVNIGEMKFPIQLKSKRDKWVKAGEVLFKKGINNISLKFRKGLIKVQDNFSVEVMLISTVERSTYEERIKTKELNYLYFKEKERGKPRIFPGSKEQENEEAFNMTRDGVYRIKASVVNGAGSKPDMTISVDGNALTLRKEQDAGKINYSSKVLLKEGAHRAGFNFEPDIFGISRPEMDETDLPDVAFTRISPTKYIANVKGAKTPFLIILSESYHDGWKASVKGGPEFKTHFEANMYANAWLIEPDRKENFEVVIEYAPQRLFTAGVITSLTSLLCFLGYIGLKKKSGEVN
ncbi:MAG: DUF3367 domain-containing protein [Deltaproteobacteria bacterium]|nr:DUF3367 domain-containing protein [Deltaproteobacteria bacterium]